MNFSHLMNTKRFSPTAAQMIELKRVTQATIGADRVNFFLLSNVDMAAGTAQVEVKGVKMNAARLASNGRWYVLADYAY
jgi:hypothetical protein